MFMNKTNVEKIIQKNKFKSEKERNLHGYRIGKLYYNCNEYELARRYVSGYLTVVPDSAPGHRLLAECLEKLNRSDAALKSYRTSLELNPQQKDLLLKICELMASSEVTLDQSKALYWCEQAQHHFPNHPTLFSLRERIVTSDKDSNSDEVEKLILSELEQCPTDVGLRIRLLQHLLRSNKISDAYKHAYEIEQLKYNIFAENLTWYETVGEILNQYQRDNSNNDLSYEFWIFYTSVLDKIASLQLDEQSVTSIVNCKNAIFNFDQTFKIAVENVKKLVQERNLVQEYTIHYHGQLCLHLATLHFKKAKIDKISFKEASRLNIPLLLGAWSSPPAEMNAGWLNQSSDSTRKWIQRWNLEANYRASQAGHILLSILGEHPTNFSDKLVQICSGNWRERLFKLLFVTREQLLKIKTSYFITCPQLSEIRAVIPSQIELNVYDESSQLYRPSSLHHVVWLVLNNKFYEFKCNIFNGLQYSINNLNNCAAETLNVLDIQAFIYCAAACARIVYQETRASSYTLSDKPPVLPISITENVCTPTQENWYRAAYKVYNNTCGSELGSLRLTLTNGIEVIRCIGNHGLNVNLLVLLANTFSQHEKIVKDVTKKEFISTRATLYWKNAIPLLERLKNNQTIKYPSTKKSLFDYRDKDFTLTAINQHLEDGKLYLACKLKEQHDYEKALEMFQGLKSPYATFHQAQIYKTLAAEQIGQNKENVTSEMRSQHIIFLSKARDCFYLTLDRLKEPSIDRKHPLNCELGTEIENIESMLSRIDPDICTNQNDCENISDENISSVGSMGDHIQIASTFGLNYSNGNGVSRNIRTRHISMQSTPFRNVVDLDTSIKRTEARPSPERLEAQIRQMSVTKDTFVSHILEQNRQILEQNRSMLDAYRTLSEEIRNLKDEVRNELTTIKESLTDQLPMIKKEISELKKDTSKLKNNTQLNDEDLYDVFEGIGNDNDYNIQAAIQAASSAFNQSPLYSGFNTRPPLNYPAAAMYPGIYPTKMYGYHPGLSAAHTAQATGVPLVQPVVSLAPSHISGLASQPTIPSALGITTKDVSSPIITKPNVYKTVPHQKNSQDEDVEEDIEDVYEDEEYDYNIHAAAVSNTLNQYQGITPRPPLNYPAAAAAVMYPGMYPTTMYGYHPALPATLPYGDSSQLPTINLNTSQSLGAPLVQTVVSQPLIASLPQISSPQISNLVTPTKDASNNTLINKTPPVNVVITASDPVPTTVTTSQPVLLSVTIPPQHLKGNIPKTTSQSQPHSYQISLPSNIPSFPTFNTTISPATTAPMPITTNNLLSNISAPVFTSLTDQKNDSKNIMFGFQSDSLKKSLLGTSPFKTEASIEDANKSNISTTSFDEQDPCPDFKPIIPLPDEIVVKTGEEDEQVLFKERAKLFRYVDREWKERGVGDVKLLYDSKSGKVRLLMRRDQIHKICANHYITTTMELSTLSTSDRAYVWAANDFADEEVRLEKLCIRFKTPEQSKKFYDAFENAKKLVRDAPTSDQQIPPTSQNNKSTSSKLAAPMTITTTVPTSLGGFTFSSTPIFEPKKAEVTLKDEKPPDEITPSKPSPFAGFSFKPACTTVDLAPLRKPNLDPSDAIKTQQPEIKGYFSPKDPNLQPFSVVSTILTSSPLATTATMVGTQKTATTKVDTKEADSEEFVPTAEFKPVIPLPDLIEVKTGEEDEKVLFCERAKLFRYDSENKEWKERGLGDMKILLSGIVRLLMRREQILKICCNHQVTKTMKFTQTNDKLVSWAAQDFSENELKNELFQIRFKTSEIASKFITTLENIQKDMDSSNFIEEKSADNKTNESVKPAVSSFNSWGDQFKPKAGQWECKGCYITNNADVLYCIACDSPKDETIPKKEKSGIKFETDSTPKFTFGIPPSTKPSETLQKGWGDQFKPKSGSWECKNCYVSNDKDKINCVACNMSKDGTTVGSTKSEDNLASKFTFGIPTQTTMASTPKTSDLSLKSIQSSWGDEFKPKPGSWSCKSCYISNDASSQQCIACNSQKDGTAAPQQSNILVGDTPTKFTFGIPQLTTPIFATTTTPKSTTGGFTFGTTPVSTMPKFLFQKDDGTEKKDDKFGFQFNKSMPLFGTPKTDSNIDNSSKETPKYTFGSPDKFEFVFTPRSPRKSCGEESDGNATEDEGEHIHFTPIIPLPEKIDVKTGEEDEDVLYCHRAKLFIFAAGEWKERGLGDVKLLQHKQTKKLRMVMRRDQVLKICLNHALTKDVEYLVKDDKSWLFSVPDFSEGQIEHHQFCIRFKTSDIAKDFRTAISNALESGQQSKEKEISENNENRDDNDNDDVVLVLPQISPELVKKAKDLMLPDLFYAYLDKSPCEGCIGCDPDSYEFKQTEKVEKCVESFSFSKTYSSLSPDTSKLKSIFGGSPSKEETKETDTSSQVKSIFGNAKIAFGSANFSFGTSSLSGGNTTNIFSGTPSPQQSIFSGNNTSQDTQTASDTTTGLRPSIFGQITPNNKSIFSTTSTNLFGTPKPEGNSVSSENKFNTSGSIFSTNSTSLFSTPTFGLATTTNVFGGSTTNSADLNKSGTIFSKTESSRTVSENKQTDANTPKQESGFGSLKSETFADFSSLAQTSSNQTIFSEKNKSFQFEGAGAPVFASLKKLPMKTKLNESENDNETHVQDDEYDPHYEPIIPMPEMIQVSTGEEDEEKLFCQRAKLFRYDTKLKEWKERGVGEMKILHHPQRQTYRFILRREQVHKLVLNQLLRADMELKKLNKADNAFCWGGYNFCGDGEDSGVVEEFAIRFKNQQLAEQFYNTVIKCQEELKKIIPAQIPISVEEKDLNNEEGENEDYDDEEWDDEEDDEEEEEEDYNEEEYDKSVVWEKHCKLQMYTNGKFTPIGEGDIKIICDTTTYENRIFFANDDGELLTNTPIVSNVTMEQNENICTWTAVEDVIKDNVAVTLRAEFDTEEDAQEFYENFKESITH